MALNPDIRDQAYQFFIEEAPELLQNIEAGLLNLRQDRSTANVHGMMRAAHSLKGGSASVELEAIKTIAHRLENIFKALYNKTVEIDTDLESQLLQAYDCLRLPLMEQIATNQFDQEQALAIAEPIFEQIEARLGDALTQADNFIPSSSELGVDMALSIFEVDVEQGLELLSQVVADPDHHPVAGELRAQADVFSGFAEFLNLPGFGAIANTAITALNAHPDKALEITQVALADFDAGRLAVLNGDRSQGGTPSPQLMALAGVADETPPARNREAGEAGGAGEAGEAEFKFKAYPGSIETPSLAGKGAGGLGFPASEESLSTSFLDPDTEPLLADLEAGVPSLEDVFGEIEADTSQEEEEVEVEVEEEVVVEPEPEEELTAASASSLSIPAPETLEEAIASIGQVYEELPEVEDLPAPAVNNDTTPTVTSSNLVPSQSGSSELSATHPSAQPTSENQEPESVSPKPSKSKQEAATPHLSVRVDSERLERMNNLVGELAINRNGLSLQHEQLQRSVRELLERFSRVQTMVNHLRELSDKMLISPERYNPQINIALLNQLTEFVSRTEEFDSLELDNYSILNSRLQQLIEDMVQVEESVDDVALFAKQSDQTLEQQRQMLTSLRDELMWARMLPLGEVLNRYPRVIRDLSTRYEKSVNLKLNGTNVLVDKAALEKLYDPLMHLLRNAFDHGIELPEVRRQQGKPEVGQIEIRAYHQGSQTIIEVKDDGQGLNIKRIGQQAIDMGLVSPEQLTTLTPNRLFEFLFEPGFSTAEQVSELSGRGVGLDVVRSQMRSLKGTISVHSSPGVGTTFTLRLPLTLTIGKLLVCFVGSTALALPSDSVEEIVIPKGNQVKTTGEQRFLRWRGQIVPTYRLTDLLDYTCPLPETCPSQALVSVPSPTNWALPMLVLRQDQYVLALEIDRLVTEQELVIKPFGSAIAPPSFTYGCTILGDGSLIPVIDGAVLMDQLLGQSSQSISITSSNRTLVSIPESRSAHNNETKAQTAKAPTVLVVDDAVALRRTLALTLERAGCRVLQARDGREALEQLRQSSAVDLVVCDIEMPNMNGFEFLGQRRQDPQISKVPVVMLTSRSNDKHRWLARHLGANAYFTKPYLEQEFLGAIEQILIQDKSQQPQLQPS
ncbi:MAG: hybrid sensor histidine kinase/response regulator [Coleofasciculus chthonoplastes F3-SA18-01]|uniref:response regulator n=1 Tax=Coleofasciculus chthonoplastes TaxID=64178 RepID=UPI0032F77F81